jgi:hypothetical protein
MIKDAKKEAKKVREAEAGIWAARHEYSKEKGRYKLKA